MEVRDPISALNELAARYERRAAIVRQISDFVGTDATLAAEVVAALTGGANGQQPDSSAPPRQTHFTRIRDYFEGNSNSWRSAPHLMRALGMNRGAVSHVLYKTHGGDFDRRKHPQKRLILWRLQQKEVQSV